MSNIFDVITLGSNTVDVFVKTDPEESELVTIRHGTRREEKETLVAYPLGSKIIIKEMEFQVGGGGTNTAVAFSRLGLRTAYLGKIGKDENGLKVFKLLKKEKVEFIGTLGEKNGYSVILDSIREDRTILTYKGCNNDFKLREVNEKKLKAKYYYLCSMSGESFYELEKIAQKGKKQGAKIVFNPSEYIARMGTKKLGTILKNTNMLILNYDEARIIGGFGTKKELVERLRRLGPKTIVITDGSKGAIALHENKFYEGKPKENIKILETTGAGDAFGSTLTAGLIMNHSFEESMKMAFINAESVITAYGAKNILLSKKEMEEKLREDKRKINVEKIK